MSGWYLSFKQACWERTIPADAGIYIVGVNDDFVFDEGDVDFTNITPHIILDEIQLTNVTFTDGVLDADDIEWLSAGAGITDRSLLLVGVVFYFQKDTEGTLICFIDSAHLGLPQLLTGSNVSGKMPANGIAKL
jgi:hypothetical protein